MKRQVKSVRLKRRVKNVRLKRKVNNVRLKRKVKLLFVREVDTVKIAMLFSIV